MGVESTIQGMTAYLETPVEKPAPLPSKEELAAIRAEEAVIKRVEKAEADQLKQHLKEKAMAQKAQVQKAQAPAPASFDSDASYASSDPARVGADQAYRVWYMATKGIEMLTPRIDGLHQRVERHKPRYIHYMRNILAKRGMGELMSDEWSLAMLVVEDTIPSIRPKKRPVRRAIAPDIDEYSSDDDVEPPAQAFNDAKTFDDMYGEGCF
jgi:LPS O-antigen subunit length determinant protein (WzzB/FepE family)